MFFLGLLVACDGQFAPEQPSQYARVGELELEVPADWTASVGPSAGHVSTTWTPGATNPRRESVTVIRSEVDNAFFRRGGAYLQQMLMGAQKSLPRARASRPVPVTTDQGLTGMRLTVDYVPEGQRVSYHRVHVVLLDKTGLVHVLYTAREPDRELAALEMILSTLRREEARS